MKCTFYKKSDIFGFTLIEIIVVMIIIGILASISLPSLFGNVARSKAAEAMATMGVYKDAVEGCIQNKGGVTNCGSLTSLGFVGSATLNGNFFYNLATTPIMSIVGFPVAASSAINYVQLSRAGVAVGSGTWQCQGFGIYAGVC